MAMVIHASLVLPPALLRQSEAQAQHSKKFAWPHATHFASARVHPAKLAVLPPLVAKPSAPPHVGKPVVPPQPASKTGLASLAKPGARRPLGALGPAIEPVTPRCSLHLPLAFLTTIQAKAKTKQGGHASEGNPVRSLTQVATSGESHDLLHWAPPEPRLSLVMEAPQQGPGNAGLRLLYCWGAKTQQRTWWVHMPKRRRRVGQRNRHPRYANNCLYWRPDWLYVRALK